MAIDLRLVFQSRGQDQRRFVLVAFGGAGPLHACGLARELHIPTVLVPPHPGITSAIGLLQTQVKHVYVQSAIGLLRAFAPERMNQLFAELQQRATSDVVEEGLEPASMKVTREMDLRYRHQGYELSVTCPAHEIMEQDKAELKAQFDRNHLRIYGASAPEEDVEVVTLRIICEVAVPHLQLPTPKSADGDASQAVGGERQLYNFERADFEPATVYRRGKLCTGDRFEGPAIVEQFDATTVLYHGQAASVDGRGNLLIATGAEP